MCFSASASFGVSLGLSVLGVASLRKVKDPSQYSFATIPLVFAAQQFVEGIVWLSMTKPGWEGTAVISSIIFLLFAQVVWPVWLPVSFLRMEKEARRKRILKLFLIPGLMVSAYFLFCLYTYAVETEVVRHHIFYNLDFPGKLIPYAAAFYLVSTAIPPLGSRNGLIQSIGVVIFGSYVVARLFFQPSLISVWCWFTWCCAMTRGSLYHSRNNIRGYTAHYCQQKDRVCISQQGILALQHQSIIIHVGEHMVIDMLTGTHYRIHIGLIFG
jgi:hypothetical protein